MFIQFLTYKKIISIANKSALNRVDSCTEHKNLQFPAFGRIL